MRWCNVLLILLFFFSVHLLAQNSNRGDFKYLNPIFGNTLTTYSFRIEGGRITQDSVISSVRTYNKAGRRTHTKIYSRDTLRSVYEFMYEDDTLLTYRNKYVFIGEKKLKTGSSSFHYDKKGRPVSQIDLPVDIKKYSPFSNSTQYDRKGRRILGQFMIGGHPFLDIKLTYKGNDIYAKEIHSKKGEILLTIEKLIKRDKKGRTLQVFKKQEDGSYKLIMQNGIDKEGQIVQIEYFGAELSPTYGFEERIDFARFSKNEFGFSDILGISGRVSLEQNDYLRQVFKYDSDCKLIEAHQYLNENLQAHVKYVYSKH